MKRTLEELQISVDMTLEKLDTYSHNELVHILKICKSKSTKKEQEVCKKLYNEVNKRLNKKKI